MFFVCYGNFPSYCYRDLLVITWCYGARVYANQYMQISILNRTALFTAFLSPGEAFVRRAILRRIKQIMVDRKLKSRYKVKAKRWFSCNLGRHK